ncbi:unnamed protein product, partial [Prorocentrum cordatum]
MASNCDRSVRRKLSGSATHHLLFVYGTLKRGLTNYKRYLEVSVNRGGARFVGLARTQELFPLVIRPADILPPTRAPVLMDVPDTGHAIEGEVFQVDDSTLAGLDILEGVASGKYYRDSIEVHVRTTCSAEALRLTCACYFFRARSELMSQERISHYSRCTTRCTAQWAWTSGSWLCAGGRRRPRRRRLSMRRKVVRVCRRARRSRFPG